MFGRVIHLVVCVVCISLTSKAQPSADLARLQTKYPGKIVVTESSTRDISFKMSKTGKPELSFDDKSSLFVLADNSTVLSESKEYFNSRLEIKELEAYSLVPDQNTYKKYSVSKFTKTHEVGDGVFYDDLYSYNFNFPVVGKGSRLVTASKTVTSDAYYPITFFFGNRIPVEKAVITLTLPENATIIYKLFGYDTTGISFNKTRKGKFITYQWSSACTKSYMEDNASPSMRYFTPHIIIDIAGYTYEDKYISLIGSLNDLYAWDYSKMSKINSVPSPELKHLTDSITANQSTDRGKVNQIFKWVQQNIKYVAFEDGDNGFVPGEAALVLQRRYGDCKDKSSILTAMMHSVGLKSGLCWVGTRSLPYKYSDFPSMSIANHMIAVWWDEDNKPVLLDGTTRHHSMGEIPAAIQGKECIIEKGPDDFLLYTIPISLPTENISTDTVWMDIENGVLKGKGTVWFTGEEKSEMLHYFDGIDSTKYKDVLNGQIPMASNKFNYTSAKVSDLHNPDQPFTATFDFTLPDYITSNNGSIYVNLNIEKYMYDEQIKADRWIPLEINTPFIHRFVSLVKIPENTVVGNFPEINSFSDPKFSFKQQYTTTPGFVILTCEIAANFQILTGEDIQQFRKMLVAMNKAYTKSIVLTKNSLP
jgi:hypothetical protein